MFSGQTFFLGIFLRPQVGLALWLMLVLMLLAGVWWIIGVSRYMDVPPVLAVGLSAVEVVGRYVVAVLGGDVVDVFLRPLHMGKKRREDLCCEICEDNHVPEECPVFNGPKPQAALCGFAGGESGFFQIPTWGSKGAIPRSDGVTTFITVKEGTILGATQKVDMRYTRKMGVVRILVAVTNVNHIPESAEIVVGEGLYEIFFKVDKVLIAGKWTDTDNMGNRDGDDKEQGEDEDYSEKHGNDSFQLEELAEDTVMEDNSLHGDSKKPQDGACDMGLVSQLENQIVNGTMLGTGLGPEGLPLGMPTDLLALTSPFADQYVSTHTPGALDQSPGYGSGDGKSKSWLVQDPHCSFLAGVSQESKAAWTLSGPTASRLFLNETASRAGMVDGMDGEAVCAQPKDALGANSVSKRVKSEKLNNGDLIISAKRTNTDEDILTKAQRLAAKRNLELSESSFISLSPEVIISNCEKIGISLSSSENEVLQSVVAIKNIEIDRLTVAPSSYSRNLLSDAEEAEFDVVLSHTADRWDDESELTTLDRCCELSVAPRRKKSNKAFSNRKKEESHQQILDVCQALEVVAMEVFANHGWRSNARIEDD
uniref:Uncharacterized protein n=1 Tax=Zea mays TaxID=4577 RepID=A0A804QC22_MAIZE